jgi:hypothetical protein
MSGQAAGLDHVGIVGPDLSSLAAAWTRLGFQITPLARHEGGRTGNHCIMLDGSYLELVATLPSGTSATLVRLLARYAGIHILALRIDDEDAALVRLASAGFPDLHASRTERALDDGDPASPRVGFSLITPPDSPEGRVHLIRHLTPGTMWQERFLVHPNRVASLSTLTIVAERPAITAAWLSRVAGRAVVVDGAGLALDLGAQRLRIVPASGTEPYPALPWISGVTLRTCDANHALTAILAARAIPHHKEGAAVIVRQDDLILRFEPFSS